MKFIIVDDDPMSRKVIRDLSARADFLEPAGECSSAAEAILLLSKANIDLIFLDIEMPGMSGLDMLKKLPAFPQIILTTSYKEFAVQSYEHEIADYLLKPVSPTRFNQAVQKARGKLANEKRQENILDSIHYAKEIQDALLLKEEEIEKEFPYPAFILFQPKDIVSGDFYWFHASPRPSPLGRENEKQQVLPNGEDLGGALVFAAAADCTGHGVPGAFLSMIGNTLLNEIVKEKKIYEPGKILGHLQIKFENAFRQNNGNAGMRDGMEISICSLDSEKNLLTFSSTGNPIYIFSQNHLEEYKREHFSDGNRKTADRSFKSHTVPFRDGLFIYMASDGYADQFGGPERKRFGKTCFKNLLMEITALPLHAQKEALEKKLTGWKADMKQIDDILVMGIKVSKKSEPILI